MQADIDALERLTAAFFDAFTMRGGSAGQIDSLYDLFLPQALVVKNVDGAAEVLDVPAFVEPRRALLAGGSLQNFREWETQGRTEVFGHVAHRFSRYQKFWTASGKPYGGTGAKTSQFVRVGGAWKIAALAWDDDVLIRPLEGGDVERIREIDAACFAPDDQYEEPMYQAMIHSPESIVAVERGVLAGYAFVQRNVWEADLHIRSLAVHPQHQRRGHGQALIRATMECSPGGVDLLVAESNTLAMALYARLGFAAAERCESVPDRRRMVRAR